MNEAKLYATLGKQGISRIAHEFYAIMKNDDLIGPLYPADDWEGSEKRFRDFLLFRLGGDPTYIEERGHPRLRMRHMPYHIGEKESTRWMDIMKEALERAEISLEFKQDLIDFFAPIATFMQNDR